MNTFFYIEIQPLEREASCPWIFGIKSLFKASRTWGPYIDLADAIKALELIETVTERKEYRYKIGEYLIDTGEYVDDKIYGEVKNAE